MHERASDSIFASSNDRAGFADWPAAARMAFYTPVLEQPTLADRKATFLMTMNGMIATTLFVFIEVMARIISGPDRFRALTLSVLICVLIGLLMGAAHHAYAAYIRPLTQCPKLTFFRHVAGRPLEQYLQEMQATTHESAVDAILNYNYSVATQAVGKYARVNRALSCMRWAIPLWMMVLLLVALWR